MRFELSLQQELVITWLTSLTLTDPIFCGLCHHIATYIWREIFCFCLLVSLCGLNHIYYGGRPGHYKCYITLLSALVLGVIFSLDSSFTSCVPLITSDSFLSILLKLLWRMFDTSYKIGLEWIVRTMCLLCWSLVRLLKILWFQGKGRTEKITKLNVGVII